MKNVEDVVGAPIVAGALVTAKGRAKAAMGSALAGGVAGVVGRMAVQAVSERSSAGASPLPASSFSVAYLAVTADELVLVEGRQALVGTKAKAVVARAPRRAVRNGAIGSGGLARALTLSFDGEVTWELEVPRVNVKQAEDVLRALGVA